MKKNLLLIVSIFASNAVMALDMPKLNAGVYQFTEAENTHEQTQRYSTDNSVNAANLADVSQPTSAFVQEYDGNGTTTLTQERTTKNAVNALNYYITTKPSGLLYQSAEVINLKLIKQVLTGIHVKL